jgi:type I restriction enzyme S subunit
MTVSTARFQKYPAYKDSGVEWLGEIPEGWELARFRNIFRFSKGLNITKQDLEETGIPCINYGEIHSKYGFEVDPSRHLLKCVSNKYIETSNKSIIQYGDFIFADTSEDIEGSGNFTYLNSDQKAFAGYHTIVARLKKSDTNTRFVAYVIDSLSFRTQIRQAVKGVKVYSITNSILKNTVLWFPPLPEQTAIATFLDDKTAKIDRAIAQKEKLIALLQERKQIIIQDLVTGKTVWSEKQKAFVPLAQSEVEGKDSGVAWIGEIPAGWEVSKLKYYTRQIVDGAHFTPTYVESGVPFLRVTDISKEFTAEIDWSKTKYIPEKEHSELIKRANPEKGDVLLSKNGTIGITKVIDWDEEFSFFVSLCLLKLTKRLNPYFFCQFFDSPLVDQQIALDRGRYSLFRSCIFEI